MIPLILEDLLRVGWHLELTTSTAKIYLKTENGLSQDVEIETQYKDKKGELIDVAINKMLNPFLIAERILPLDKNITQKMDMIIASRIHIDISCWYDNFEIRDHDCYPSQKPPVCCGGLSGTGKTLPEAIDSMLAQIKRAQTQAKNNKKSCPTK